MGDGPSTRGFQSRRTPFITFVGVYSLRNSIIDCAICAVFGFLGYILKRLKLPIVLGMVLGNIMEQKFRASLARV